MYWSGGAVKDMFMKLTLLCKCYVRDKEPDADQDQAEL